MLGITPKYLDPPPVAAMAVFLPHAVHLYVQQVLTADYGYTKMEARNTGLYFFDSPKRQGGYYLRAFMNLDEEMDTASRELTQALERGFICALQEGKFTAWARTTPLYGRWFEIPPYTWLDLWPLELSKGLPKDPRVSSLRHACGGARLHPQLDPDRQKPHPKAVGLGHGRNYTPQAPGNASNYEGSCSRHVS